MGDDHVQPGGTSSVSSDAFWNVAPSDVLERLPKRVGPYRVTGLLGVGGMGVVYLAEQDSPRRTVAVKVMHAGRISDEVRQRFRHEVRVLSQLRHPYIAQIFDAGMSTTDFGSQPYFAMEHVDGQALTTYVREKKLSPADMASLLARVCDAVTHAHSKGIIHRDLKPANILVTSDGTPKILDFGVARVTESQIDLTMMHTTTRQLIGTLPYMSPEQVLGAPDGLDTRSDVYALGTILYEMLTEKLPIDVRDIPIAQAARRINDVVPVSPGTIDARCRGDLETVVLKALRKSPEHRYQSAGALAEDLRRFIAHEPILARPTTAFYQLSRFARRNRTLVGGIAGTFVALVIGIITTNMQAMRAKQANRIAQTERQIAEEERNRALASEARSEQRRAQAEAVTSFLTDALTAADPRTTLGDELSVRDMLDSASREVDGAFGDQPLVEAAVRATIGRTYLSIGLPEQAKPHLTKSLEIRQERLSAPDADLASSVEDLGSLLEEEGDLAGAAARIKEALAIRRSLYGNQHDDVASTALHLGGVLVLDGKYKDAEGFVREGVDIVRELHGDENETVLAAESQLAEILYHLGDAVTAEEIFRANIEVRRRVMGERHPSFAQAMQRLGWFLFKQGRSGEAMPLLRESVDIHRAVYGDAHPLLASALNSLGTVCTSMGAYDQAESHYREALSIRRAYAGGDHPDVALSINDLGTLMYYKGDETGAGALFREALEMGIRLHGRMHAQTAMGMNNLAVITSNQGDIEQAVKYLREVIEIQRELLGDVHPDLALGLNNLANELKDLGEYEEAGALYAEALAIRKQLFPAAHPDIAVSLRNIGELRVLEGDVEGAIESHRESVRIMRESLGDAHGQVSSSLIGLGIAMIAGGDASGAEAPLREAVAIRRKLYPEGNWKIASAESSLGACLTALDRFAKAETLLVAGYDRVRAQKGDGNRITADCLKRVIALYDSWAEAEPEGDYAEKADAWRAKLPQSKDGAQGAGG